MKEIIEAAWEYLGSAVKVMSQNEPSIKFVPEQFDFCYERFKYWHSLILQRFMNKKVIELDRHKIAAIITISIVESKAVIYTKELKDEHMLFIGLQLLATTCGLSYMQEQLNELLEQKGINPIEKYIMPEPFSCNTKYLEVIARNLYYEEYAEDNDGKKLWNLNPLQLANTFYLIELYSLEYYKIPTTILKENE